MSFRDQMFSFHFTGKISKPQFTSVNLCFRLLDNVYVETLGITGPEDTPMFARSSKTRTGRFEIFGENRESIESD